MRINRTWAARCVVLAMLAAAGYAGHAATEPRGGYAGEAAGAADANVSEEIGDADAGANAGRGAVSGERTRTGFAQGGGAGGASSDAAVVVSTAIVLNDVDPSKLKPPDTLENNPIARWARKKLGVAQENLWILPDEPALRNKLKQALNGEEALPDVLYLNDHILPGLLNDIAASGRFMDLEAAFAAYASPRMKEAYARHPDVWRTVRVDGKLWGLPQISDGKVGDPILWIRGDWLDRLGLEAPATLEELETVMASFVRDDPDGNGAADTYGLALAGKHTLNGWMGDASFLFGAYGPQPYQWNRGADGKLAYGSVQPEIERSLAKLAEWYANGLLHPDFGTHDEPAAAALFAEGRAGVISGPGWMGGWPLSELPSGEPTSSFRPIPYPSGPDGRVGRKGSKISYGSYVFRKDFEHIEAVFRYWDEVYGALIEDPASDFAIGFAEGYDYVMKDGEPVYDFPGATSTISQFFLVAPGSVPPGVMDESLEERVYRGLVRTPYEKKLAATASRLYLEGRLVGDLQLDAAQRDEFLGPHSPAMLTKWPALQQLEKEAFLKIVYGNEPSASFADFVRDWHAYGGETITDEVNRWDEEN